MEMLPQITDLLANNGGSGVVLVFLWLLWKEVKRNGQDTRKNGERLSALEGYIKGKKDAIIRDRSAAAG